MIGKSESNLGYFKKKVSQSKIYIQLMCFTGVIDG